MEAKGTKASISLMRQGRPMKNQTDTNRMGFAHSTAGGRAIRGAQSLAVACVALLLGAGCSAPSPLPPIENVYDDADGGLRDGSIASMGIVTNSGGSGTAAGSAGGAGGAGGAGADKGAGSGSGGATSTGGGGSSSGPSGLGTQGTGTSAGNGTTTGTSGASGLGTGGTGTSAH
jgi:hypothetical protein